MQGFEALSEREFLITNGIGGYASSSLSGANTRRYHGILVASFDPPTERMVLVSKLEETLLSEGQSVELSANQYQGTVHPQGFSFLHSTGWLDNTFTFTYSGNDLTLQILWGEWALGYLKVHGFSPEACKVVWDRSARLREHFYNEGCVRAISEIFDGLQPGEGKGCIQQAWSVAALLRVFLDQQFDFRLC